MLLLQYKFQRPLVCPTIFYISSTKDAWTGTFPMDTPTEAMAHDDHSQLCWQHRCDWWDPKGWWCKSISNSSWPSFVSVVVLVVKQTCMWKGTHLSERIFYIWYKMKCNVSKCWAMQSFWKSITLRGIANTLPHAPCVRFFSPRYVLAKRIWPNMKFAEAPSAETKQSSWSGKRIAIE